jgi:hypothetical protein
VSKERARRRAERLAVAEREKVVRARKVARRLRRQAWARRLSPRRLADRRRRPGRLSSRSRAERMGAVLLPLFAGGAIWTFVPSLGLRLVLTVLLVLALPAALVVKLGRR